MRAFISIITGVIGAASSLALAEDAQVTLKANKSAYARDEPIDLSYEVLWLGQDDARLYVNSLAFPELEVSFLNRFPVEITVIGSFEVRTEPSRHERRTVAPTMSLESQVVPINSLEGVRFLNGQVGYYHFDRVGTYVVRAVFRHSSNWKLHDGQEADIRSSAIVIEIVE